MFLCVSFRLYFQERISQLLPKDHTNDALNAFKSSGKLDVVAQAFHPRIWETEGGGSVSFRPAWSRTHRAT